MDTGSASQIEKPSSPEELAQDIDLNPELFEREFPSDYDAYMKYGNHIPNWEELAPVLGLTGQEIQFIRSNRGLADGMHAREVLKKWKTKGAFNSTYRQLVDAYLKLGDSNTAMAICKEMNRDSRLGTVSTPTAQPVGDSPDCFPTFSAWLKSKGLSQQDIQTLNDEGFGTSQGFALLVPDDLEEIQVTRGGKKVILRLIAQFKDISSKVTSSQHPPVTRSSASGAGSSVSYSTTPQPSTGAGPQVSQVNEINYRKADCSKFYNTMVRCSVTLNHAMSKDPQSLAKALFNTGFISPSTLEETNELNETKSAKGSRLYSAVLGRVRNFPNKFADFINVLRQDRSQYGDVLTEIDRVYSSSL